MLKKLVLVLVMSSCGLLQGAAQKTVCVNDFFNRRVHPMIFTNAKAANTLMITCKDITDPAGLEKFKNYFAKYNMPVIKINLTQNKLHSLPDCLVGWPELRYIDVSHNQFAIVPNVLSSCAELRELNISYNKIKSFVIPYKSGERSEIDSKDFWQEDGFPVLSELNLAHNRLAVMPENIHVLEQLVKLDVSFNRLTYLPESIGDMPSLQELYLHGGGTGKVPDNTITSLPASFEKLKKLRVLMIGGLNLDEESMKLLGRMQDAQPYLEVVRKREAIKTPAKLYHNMADLVRGSAY
ncbi:leucine-rich repeat domain-containing protein [Candidatus Babeliales bacterium]|nr:leucine-rich repeat domain-containing protein [Candidatus Babeliales bacterium]